MATMIDLTFEVSGASIIRTDSNLVVADNQRVYRAVFSVSADWEGLSLMGIFRASNGTDKSVDLADLACEIPMETMPAGGSVEVSLHGRDSVALIYKNSDPVTVPVRASGKPESFTPPADPSQDQYEAMLQAALNAASAASAAASQAATAALQAQQAAAAAAQAAQALADTLALTGSPGGLATLGMDGKLTPGQINDLSINDVTEVASTDAMLLLTAQRGDVALVMGVDGEGNPIVTDSYILSADDPTVLSNWKRMGVSYVANAGHAVNADTATNATMINNKRVIGMTQTQYDTAYASGTLDADTYYIVVPDEV